MTLYSSVNLFLINLFTRLVPRRLFPPFAFITAGIVYFLAGTQRRGTRENLRVVTGRRHVEGLLISTFYKYARNWADVMLMMRLTGERLFSLIGRRSTSTPLDNALAVGTGAILVSPHFGNWELGGLGLADLGYKINVLTFREPDEKVNELRERVRGERGIGFIYVDRHDTSPLAIIEAVNALRRNEIVALLGDRDGSSHTMSVEFFGRPANIPLGAAYLSLASGAPVIPVFVPLEGGRYATIMEEPIHFRGGHRDHGAVIREGVEQLIRLFEKYIRAYPDQWYNFFPYWDQSSHTKG
ncbi:lysophospholipid acyltransferase family protein [Geobacter hydrogenophilus]|uniref:lysophospholipid acyltransferase family protein n=1 Tax=Geobacter hydrogenophilus TaxID=40983 RepID=UPI001BDAE910|nr:lysophospholipid acyltransferase family protein [Geobacter hydrogenophilus]MBT0893002.1 lysophospholipid acyltransferase family protein [Geobacter hydrogenophilus]